MHGSKKKSQWNMECVFSWKIIKIRHIDTCKMQQMYYNYLRFSPIKLAGKTLQINAKKVIEKINNKSSNRNQWYRKCIRGKYKKSKIGCMKRFIQLIKLIKNEQEKTKHKLESLKRKKVHSYRPYRLLNVSRKIVYVSLCLWLCNL